MTSTERAIYSPHSPFAGCPLPMRPSGRVDALARGLERLTALRDEMIAKAIAELDALSWDSDAEDGGDDEHEIGWSGDIDQTILHLAANGLELADGDREPSLGRSETISQTRCFDGMGSAGGEDEWSLGWQNTGSQVRLVGGHHDHEAEHDGREPDHEGLNGDEADGDELLFGGSVCRREACA